ncbi:hypothetical protein ACJX0J_020162, partial [Zea mays]
MANVLDAAIAESTNRTRIAILRERLQNASLQTDLAAFSETWNMPYPLKLEKKLDEVSENFNAVIQPEFLVCFYYAQASFERRRLTFFVKNFEFHFVCGNYII